VRDRRAPRLDGMDRRGQPNGSAGFTRPGLTTAVILAGEAIPWAALAPAAAAAAVMAGAAATRLPRFPVGRADRNRVPAAALSGLMIRPS
jgi:hypothetical protein